MRAQNPLAGKWNDQIEMRRVHLNGERVGRLTSFGSKVATRGKEPAVALLGRQGKRRSPPACRAAKIRHRQRFLEMQFARFPVRIYAPVIVNAISQVRILLHFKTIMPGPMVCGDPAGTKIVSPVCTTCAWNSDSSVCVSNPRRNCCWPTPGFKPSSNCAFGSAEKMCHISVLPCPPIAFSCAEAYASSG